jgi:hypothetical protein
MDRSVWPLLDGMIGMVKLLNLGEILKPLRQIKTLQLDFNNFDAGAAWHGYGNITGNVGHQRGGPTENPFCIIWFGIYTSMRHGNTEVVVPERGMDCDAISNK